VEDPRFRAFMKGYSVVRPMLADVARQIQFFLRMHNLVTFAKILRATEESTTDGPGWTGDLRKRLARKLDQYRQAFKDSPLRTFTGGR
jgi:Ser/Thr protein kinase RdoA (MazF antagonist)